MDTFSIALQRAMAAEIRSRLGRRNRSQAWLQREAQVPAPTWRRYFTDGAIEREVPMPVVLRIAKVLDMTGHELVEIAEETAEDYAPALFEAMGATPAEQADLEAAIERNRRSTTEQKPGRRSELG